MERNGVSVCIAGLRVTWCFGARRTGSGKTYTMAGSPEDPGVNMRALEALFAEAAAKAPDIEYEFSVSVAEIYNEKLHDLLGKPGAGSDLAIHVDADKRVVIPGLTKQCVASRDDVKATLEKADGNRTVGGHDANAHSSRSHMVVTVEVVGNNHVADTQMGAKLSLIDLAGSERIGKTNATGQRLEEAKAINKSLSALGNVIEALSAKSRTGKGGHVPFRNSKLTYLLSDCLGGDSKVAMFVNVSPIKRNADESKCSLQFAERCRSVQLKSIGQRKQSSSGGHGGSKHGSATSRASKAAADRRVRR